MITDFERGRDLQYKKGFDKAIDEVLDYLGSLGDDNCFIHKRILMNTIKYKFQTNLMESKSNDL